MAWRLHSAFFQHALPAGAYKKKPAVYKLQAVDLFIFKFFVKYLTLRYNLKNVTIVFYDKIHR
ncbi:hypothetical protein OBV_07290 [Oscillibacter valericigenes Sjm18-20]|nr:hypothetical protein OBV_07290 [Oscillibacter valericigenes Sjm18-20]